MKLSAERKGSRPLLSRSGCICDYVTVYVNGKEKVLVPFYRGAVVFSKVGRTTV